MYYFYRESLIVAFIDIIKHLCTENQFNLISTVNPNTMYVCICKYSQRIGAHAYIAYVKSERLLRNSELYKIVNYTKLNYALCKILLLL